MKYSTILISILATSQNDKADATFTIAATDKSTGQIGARGSSCVSFDLYTVVYHSIPKHGLCLTQAMPPSNPGWDPSATKLSPVYSAIDTLLSNDTDPSVIIDVITNKDFDDGTFETELYFFDSVNLRQYGCVNLQQQAAGYTGKDLDELYAICMPFGKDSVQEDVQGTVGDVVYSAQGK